jgi:hypothetical protein
MRRLVLMCKYLRSHNNDQTKREPHTQIPGAPGAIGAKIASGPVGKTWRDWFESVLGRFVRPHSLLLLRFS